MRGHSRAIAVAVVLTLFALLGSAAAEPLSDWQTETIRPAASLISASVVLTPAVGDHLVTAAYGGTPQFGPSTSSPSTIHIEPGPTIERLRATPDVLWPPNHKMVTVTAAATVIDIGDPVPACGIRSITSSEADNGLEWVAEKEQGQRQGED